MFTMKKLTIALSLLLTAACATMPMNSSSKDSAGASLAPAGIATKSTDASSYILFSDPKAVRTIDWSSSIYGLNIKGTMTSKGFYPAGKIEGHGSFCADGKDWFSLNDLTVHKASDGKTPAGSYVLGCAVASGFQPASRDAVVVQ